MTPEKWKEVKVVLAEALEVLPEQRRQVIELRCNGDYELQQEIESLLVYAEESTVGITQTTSPVIRGPAVDRVGRTIGPYKLQKLLGEGGMGSVYLAVREVDGYSMRVALKIMRVTAMSEYSLRRFRMERQILARLTHPNITRLLDGGVTDEGLPYLVTEYIEGTPIDQYYQTNRPSIAERLRVFLSVCSGLSFAHRNLIVHGDIKPANILVTPDGTAKLVDFGIARLLDADSAASFATTTYALTPGWASPEQLGGTPPTVLSDLYSLGRVFYEVITEQQAYQLQEISPAEYLNVLSQTPPAPSAVSGNSILQGDLDDIAIKAIEFEPEQRYQSADQFAADIEAYLDSRPILARHATWQYRTTKFIRRHRRGVVIASLITLTLLSLVAATLWQTRRAREQYDVAARQAGAIRKLANSFIFDLDDAVAEMPGATQIRANIMTNAVGYLDRLAKESSQDPELQQELGLAYLKIGDIMGRPGSSNLGRTAAALESYRKAQRILEPLVRRNQSNIDAKLNLAQLYNRISAVQKVIGNFEDALEDDLKSLDIREGLLQSSPDDQELRRAVAQSLTSLGGTHSQLGEWSRVVETRKRALRMFEQLIAADPKNLADRRGLVLARTRLASILSHQNQHGQALDQLHQAVAEQKSLLDENPANSQIMMAYGGTISSLARGLSESGDTSGSLNAYEQAYEIYKRLVVVDSADVRSKSLLAATDVAIGRILVRTHRAAKALPRLEPALRTRIELSERDPMNSGALGEVAEGHAVLGDAYFSLNKPQAAKQSYTQAREILLKLRADGKENAADSSLLGRVEAGLARIN